MTTRAAFAAAGIVARAVGAAALVASLVVPSQAAAEQPTSMPTSMPASMPSSMPTSMPTAASTPGDVGPAAAAGPSARETRTATEVAASILQDGPIAPEVLIHGAITLRLTHTRPRATLVALFDTETVRLAARDLRLSRRTTMGAELAGEMGFAGLLPDYFRDGVRDGARGFQASYVSGAPHVSVWLGGPSSVRVEALTRRWWFDDGGGTADALVLPADTLQLDATAAYTFWRLDGDPLGDVRTRFARVRGLAFGVSATATVRPDAAPWGALDAASFDPVDTSNDPSTTALRTRAWLRSGSQLAPGLRWQTAHSAAFGVGEDDVTGDRLGGLNPYVVPIAGQAWASWVSSRYVAASWSWHVALRRAHEAGLQLDGALVDDIGRTGTSHADALFGAAVFADLRFGGLQIDARLGASPARGAAPAPASALVAVGFAQTWRR